MNDTLKRYLISSGITFLAFFGIAILPELNNLTLQSVQTGALASLVFTGLRAGLKGVIEAFVAWYQTKNSNAPTA